MCMHLHLARTFQWALAMYIIAITTVWLTCFEGYRAICRKLNIRDDKLDDDNVDLVQSLYSATCVHSYIAS